MILKLAILTMALFIALTSILSPELPGTWKRKPWSWLAKIKKLREFNEQVSELLLVTKSKIDFKQYSIITALLSLTGLAIGVFYNNPLFSLILFVGFPYAQYQLLLKKTNDMTRMHNEKLEIYMSMVTNSYLQNSDITAAIARSYSKMDANEPAAKPFGAFIGQVAINADVTQCIQDMKKDIGNPYFNDWCDKLMFCHDDSSLKKVLPYSINRMRRIRTLDAETVTNSSRNYSEYIAVCVFSMMMVFLSPFMMAMWHYIVFETFLGKVMLGLVMAVIFLASGYVVKVSRPERSGKR